MKVMTVDNQPFGVYYEPYKTARQNPAQYFMQELVDRLNIPAKLQGKTTSPYHENGWIITSDRSGSYTQEFTELPAMAQFFAYHVNSLVNTERGWNLEALRVTDDGHLAIEAVFHSPIPICFEEQVKEPAQKYVGRDILRLRWNPYQTVIRTRTNYFLDVESALNPDLIAPVAVPEEQDIYTDHLTVFTADPVSIPPFLTLPDLMEMGSNPKAPIPKGISRFYIRGMEFRAFPFQRVRVAEDNTELVSVWQNVPRLWARIFLQRHRPIIEAAIQELPKKAPVQLEYMKEFRREILRQLNPPNRIIRRLTDSKGNYSPAKVAATQDRFRQMIQVSEGNIDPTHLLSQPE